MNERIENFLGLFRTKILVQMTDEDFQANVDAVYESLTERNKTLLIMDPDEFTRGRVLYPTAQAVASIKDHLFVTEDQQ